MSSQPDNIPLQELINLNGRGVVVTGGAAGIGLGIAYRLAEAGAVVLLADINAAEARKVAGELNSRGFRAYFRQCDISKEEEVKLMMAEAAGKLGGISILVNNAGIYPRKPLQNMTGRDFEEVMAVNLTGMFLCSRYASQTMIENKQGGCIINIASIEAVHPSYAGMSAYDASKGGVLMLTKSLARELGPHGIRVNAIAPGGITTQGVRSHLGGPALSAEEERAQLKELKAFISRMALGRMGKADDVARVALFLASELAGYITGDMIVVDGGYLVS